MSVTRQLSRAGLEASGPGAPLPGARGALTEDWRYFITDRLDDLHGSLEVLERYGILVGLYQRCGELYLRHQGLWAGEGKSLGKIIARTDVGFAARYESAFSEAFGGSYERLSGLVNEILAPCGGRLFEGYLRRAPGA